MPLFSKKDRKLMTKCMEFGYEDLCRKEQKKIDKLNQTQYDEMTKILGGLKSNTRLDQKITKKIKNGQKLTQYQKERLYRVFQKITALTL